MRIIIRWTCPYCGLEQGYWSEKDSPLGTLKEVVYCDIEKGGCDRLVAVFTTIEIKATAYRIEIPGASDPLTDDEAQTLADYGDEIAQLPV